MQARQVIFQLDYQPKNILISHKLTQHHEIYSKLDLKSQLSYEDLLKINKLDSWKSDLVETQNVIKKYNIKILICDLPALNSSWVRELGKLVKVCIFDDLPIDVLSGDMVVNPNNCHEFTSKYKVRHSENLLIGQEYNPVNIRFQRKSCYIKDSTKNILIYLGSAVSVDLTKAILECVLNFNKTVTIITEHSKLISQNYSGIKNLKIFNFTNRFEDILVNIDICIGACGVSLWERCHYGIPNIIIKTAENQAEDIKYLLSKGSIELISKDSIKKDLIAIFDKLINDEKLISNWSKKTFNIVAQSYVSINLTERILSLSDEH